MLKKNRMLLNPTLDVSIPRVRNFYMVDGIVPIINIPHLQHYEDWVSKQPIIGGLDSTLEQICWMLLGSLFDLKSNSGRIYQFYLYCTENHNKTKRVYDMNEQNGSTWFKLFLTKI